VIWKWLTVVALSMTPALVAGPSAAILAAIGFGFSPWAYLPVVMVSSFCGGLLVMRLSDWSARIPLLERWLARARKPKAVRWCERWGPWGGLTIGAAAIGPLPILIALKWMGVEDRRIVAPLAVSSALFTLIYQWLVAVGVDQVRSILEPFGLI